MEGPGQYLGYRAMQRKVREQHKLAVPHNLVYDVMSMVDPEGMTRRGNAQAAQAHCVSLKWP